MFARYMNVQDLRAMASDVNARNYSTLAAMVFLILDYIWTLQDEVKYIWRARPYRITEKLYIISRYVPIIVQITSYVFVQVYLVNHPVSTHHCKIWFFLLGATTGILGGVTDTILFLRVRALYKKKACVFFFAIPLIAKHIFAQVLIWRILFGQSPSFTELCDLRQTPIIAAPVGALTIFCHLGLWCAIFLKRNVWDGPVLSTLVNESHWALALFTVLTIVMIPWSFHATSNPFMAFVWPITIFSFALCHILINANHLKAKIARSAGIRDGDSTTDDILFSTILDLDMPISLVCRSHSETNEIVSQVSSVAEPASQTESSTSKV